MRTFQEGQRLKFILNMLVLVVSLFVASRQKHTFKESSPFEAFLIDSLAPIQSSLYYVKDNFSNFFTHYLANIDASRENETLKHKIAKLENQVFTYEELGKENQRLKSLLQFGKKIKQEAVLAQVVARDASSDFRVLRINKGLNDGIKLQSTVVTDAGIVGYIFRLTDNFADILTILDSNNRVDAILERTRTHGIVEGYSRGRCLLKYVPRTEPVILRDVVLTSGLGNIYPKGLKIGHVTKIERESYGITQHLEISPSVDFSRLEEVIVLVSPLNQAKMMEWKALEKMQGDEI